MMDISQEIDGGVLAIDLGLRTGLARFDREGRVRWYHAQHFATRASLRRQVYATLSTMRDLDDVVMEGDPALATIWSKLPQKWEIPVTVIQAHTWREALLHPTQRDHGGKRAKHHAQELAMELIAWSGARKPTGELKHDAAEAILIGAWCCAIRGYYTNRGDVLEWLKQL